MPVMVLKSKSAELRSENCSLCGAFRRCNPVSSHVSDRVCEKCFDGYGLRIFRCTRPTLYGPGCAGHKDRTARQGYYIKALTKEQAMRVMLKDFPNDVDGFDAEPVGLTA